MPSEHRRLVRKPPPACSRIRIATFAPRTLRSACETPSVSESRAPVAAKSLSVMTLHTMAPPSLRPIWTNAIDAYAPPVQAGLVTTGLFDRYPDLQVMAGHGCEARAVSDFDRDPCPENGPSRVRNPDTNLVREPLSKPVKEEEDAQARDGISERFFEELLAVLGFAPHSALPGWWQGWPPREHVRRWRDDLGLNEAEILEAAEVSRQEHPEPPDGPKALDRIMQRVAQRKAVEASRKRCKPRASSPGPSHRQITDVPAFYADLVNSDRYLPVSAITNSTRDAMLARGLVTAERLRERGIQ